ncbi:MAG: hypothetical protein JNL30_17010 [Rubrivivax sp.]|nr:hypothetical protein [Rubrivivax sp.]
MKTPRKHLIANAAATAAAAAATALSLAAAPAFGTPGAGSAYRTDAQHSRVEDATSRGIQQVNTITCYMAAMRPDALVNQGDYLALVDEKKCDEGGRSSAGNAGGSSGGTNAPSYTTATVNSSRASNADPMRARIWLDQSDADFTATIFVNLSATAAPSASNPFGVFRIDYCGRAEGLPGCVMNGFLETGAGGAAYYEVENGGSHSKALRLTLAGNDAGAGAMNLQEGGPATHFSFAYNADYFLRGNGVGPDQCFSRDAADAATGMSVWRYGLYDADTGAREERRSGFPVEFSSGNTTHRGYMGYHGLWLPPDAQAGNGATVTRVEYNDGAAPTRTDYTLVKAEGRLTRYTKQTRTLASVDKMRLQAFIDDATNFFPGATSFRQYEMYWDQANGDFKVTAMVDCGEGGCQTQTLPSEQSVAPAFFAPRGGLRGFSQSLGGELFVPLAGGGNVDANAVLVAYRTQELVYPADMPATLHCLRDCPTAASIAAFFAPGSQATSPFAGSSWNNWQPVPANAVVSYGTQSATALLRDAADQPVVFTDREALQSRPAYMQGVRTGRLFTDAEAARCPQNNAQFCEFRVEQMDVYYQWETGPNSWNQFAALRDAQSNVVRFEAPLPVNYTVPNGAAYGDYAGKTLVLQYGGFGELWGIPGQCVSPQTNEPAACDQPGARYVPAFVIPFDQTLGRVQAPGNRTLLVKWLEREIRFARKPLNICTSAGITLPTGLSLPTANDLADPSSAGSPVYIGPKPTVSGAPRVVHGEVMY